MAVKGENSAYFGKNKINLQDLKFPSIEVPKYEMPDFNFEGDFIDVEELAERQIKKQNEILEFLKNVTLEQSQTANKQFRVSKRLTYLALIFAFISVIPIFNQLIFTDKENVLNERILELEQNNVEKSNTISELSFELLNLKEEIQEIKKLENQTSNKLIENNK